MSWDEPRGRAFRDACIVVGGSGTNRRRQWQRHDVVRALYTLSEGEPGVVVDVADLLSATGMPQGQVLNAVDSLEQDGALRTWNGDCVALLPRGIALHEQRAMRPYRAVGGASELALQGKPGLVATVPVAADVVERHAGAQESKGPR